MKANLCHYSFSVSSVVVTWPHTSASTQTVSTLTCTQRQPNTNHHATVCPDPMIRQDGPIMLQRAMQILAEASQVWPLAGRWLEILEKFARDNKGVLAGVEGSMAEGVSIYHLGH